MKRLENKKAFTLIEILVVIAVLGVLVLLAAPRFLGHTQNAELTKGFANARAIEKASELYYMDNEDWPRLTDEHYTSEEVESYSERIFDRTGHEVNLDPEGNYYDIDYDKLSDYVQVPDDKKNYILQNPVGKVYYMENLTEVGFSRVNYSGTKEEDDNPVGGGLMNPIVSRKPVEGEIAINSAEDLSKIGESEYPLSGKYILTANINLSGYSEGEGWTPIGTDSSRFTGSFDGNGYKIINLTIDKPSQDHVGLFGYTQGATIENVALEDVDVKGKDLTGGLVGRTSTSTTISNSYVTGSVTGGRNVGGLVGYGVRDTIENSYATGSVTSSKGQAGGLVGASIWDNTISNSYATGAVTGSSQVGGLVGIANNSTKITNSYATGEVTGLDKAGGLLGLASSSTTISNSYATGSVKGTGDCVGGLVGYVMYSSTTISNSYATGSVTGSSEVGGLVGGADSNITIRNSYWDRETTGQTRSVGGISKSTEDMMKQTTYSGWDFDTVWKIDEGKDYPKLR